MLYLMLLTHKIPIYQHQMPFWGAGWYATKHGKGTNFHGFAEIVTYIAKHVNFRQMTLFRTG